LLVREKEGSMKKSWLLIIAGVLLGYLTGLCQGCPFLSGVEFRPQSRLGRVSKDGSFESDDPMFWDVRPGLCRDVVPLAHQSF
jgi:hypothetical protein